ITLGHAEALTMADDKDIERFLGMAEYRSPEELKNIILNERKNLANAKFNTYKICKNCPKQSVKQQDIFGDISESYCLDGECFAKHVAEQVETIRKQFQANGFKECPESKKTSFDYGWCWVDVESEETLDEDRKFKVKWLRANGEDEVDKTERRILCKAEDLADDDERYMVKEKLKEIFRICTNDVKAIILDLLSNEFEYKTTDENGEEEEAWESWLLHVGEDRGDDYLSFNQEFIEALSSNYSSRYERGKAREFFGLGSEDEWQKRIEANKEKARKIIEKEDAEN
ncbi:hypothetical protein, partial [Fibrobacter succinogenes]|uniref:hypothetical protein n=1 Tax=Fibrobacter succinogenes TaxID=833 RepID=UPI00156482A3